MSKISLTPNASGTGTFTITSPDSNTNRTLTLPDADGALLSDTSSLVSSNLTGALPAIDGSALTGIDTSPPTTLGAVGTYAMLWIDNAEISPGSTRAGSTLRYASAIAYGTVYSTGTWRCMGYCSNTAYGGKATVWVRIS